VTGRYQHQLLGNSPKTLFQSSPGLVTGRYVMLADCKGDLISVSILARSGDRALQTAPLIFSEHAQFQSSPGLVTGRYEFCADLGYEGSRVSILARSGDRALLHQGEHLCEHWCVSILARSGDRALPTYPPLLPPNLKFQSSPGLVTGRYLYLLTHELIRLMFQSSPGLVTGRYPNHLCCIEHL